MVYFYWALGFSLLWALLGAIILCQNTRDVRERAACLLREHARLTRIPEARRTVQDQKDLREVDSEAINFAACVCLCLGPLGLCLALIIWIVGGKE